MAVNPKTLWMGDVSESSSIYFRLINIASFYLRLGGGGEFFRSRPKVETKKTRPPPPSGLQKFDFPKGQINMEYIIENDH